MICSTLRALKWQGLADGLEMAARGEIVSGRDVRMRETLEDRRKGWSREHWGEQEECEKLKRRGDEDGEKRNGDTVSKEGKCKSNRQWIRKQLRQTERARWQVDIFFKRWQEAKTCYAESVARVPTFLWMSHCHQKVTNTMRTAVQLRNLVLMNCEWQHMKVHILDATYCLCICNTPTLYGWGRVWETILKQSQMNTAFPYATSNHF